MGRGDGCTAMPVSLMSHVKMVKILNITLCLFYHNEKIPHSGVSYFPSLLLSCLIPKWGPGLTRRDWNRVSWPASKLFTVLSKI